jgi:hypothetical protein
MKRLFLNIDQYLKIALLLFGLNCFSGLLAAAPAAADNSVADAIISLNVSEKPLGEVLENLSDAAGCQFKIDAGWEDYPITASFNNEPLYRVIKRIFRDFNNAVIYGSDRTIKIIIYDDDKAAGKTTGYSVAIKPADASTPLSMPYGDATAPQSEVLAPEDSRTGEDAVQPTEENSEAGSESNQAEIENAEARQETAEAQTEDKTASLEENQNENAPAPNSDQAEEPELAADGSEGSGQTEGSEESNQN